MMEGSIGDLRTISQVLGQTELKIPEQSGSRHQTSPHGASWYATRAGPPREDLRAPNRKVVTAGDWRVEF
jgi:hypothetical protein